MGKFSIILLLIVASAFKLVVVPPLAILHYDFSFLQSVFFTSVGGASGVLLVAVLSNMLALLYMRVKTILMKSKDSTKTPFILSVIKGRVIEKIHGQWGMWGLIVLTPIMSIPLGTFVTMQYYPGLRTVCFLTLSVCAWSVALCAVYAFV